MAVSFFFAINAIVLRYRSRSRWKRGLPVLPFKGHSNVGLYLRSAPVLDSFLQLIREISGKFVHVDVTLRAGCWGAARTFGLRQ